MVNIISIQNTFRMANKDDPSPHILLKDSGIMEYWNNGMMLPLKNPIFQHSIIPGFQRG